MSDDQFLEGIWKELCQVAVKGAQYNSPERLPHPKCLKGTRVDLLKYIHTLLDDPEKNQLIWLHGTAGVGKSAVAFTVADTMRGLKVTEKTKVEKRLAGTFFFSRKHTKRCMVGYFFATLVYQLATNFPSIRKDVSRAIRNNHALLDPNTPLCDQMEALFLQPLRKLQPGLRGCQPLTFVVDALDECTSEPELTDLILSLAQALREPDLPVTHILLTSRSESHISEAFQNEEVRPLVCEIPVRTSGEGGIISLDGADVDKDISTFLQHSFRQLGSRYPNFPQPSTDDLAKLASRAGRRFIVASTMMKFIIDDEDKDPSDRLQLMLKLTSELLPGTEVFKLYDCILSTCANPKRAYTHLSIVAALADPLPISQISLLLGSGLGRDVQKTLMQLRSVVDIPVNSILPVNIHHSSIRDYVSDPSNCNVLQIHEISSPHSLLADSSLRFMMKEIPTSTALLDALSELKMQTHAMSPGDPHRLKKELAFFVGEPEPVSILTGILWLRGDRRSDVQVWLETVDGDVWLDTPNGKSWLNTGEGQTWLQTEGGLAWIKERQIPELQPVSDSSDESDSSEVGDRPQMKYMSEWLQTQEGKGWLLTQGGLAWVWDPDMKAWVQVQVGRSWLRTEGGQSWLWRVGEDSWLRTRRGQDRLWTREGQRWLQTKGGESWLQTEVGESWLQTGGQLWLQNMGGQGWLWTEGGKSWLRTEGGSNWLQTQAGQNWLQTQAGQNWLKSPDGPDWLKSPNGQAWLQTSHGQTWKSTPAASVWLALDELSNTLEAISEFVIIPEFCPLPTFQSIQQFKTLPDLLMFPAFLALNRQHHSTINRPPNRKIIHAMNTFMTFTHKAQHNSRLSSDALKYACQNWATHLSHAPDPLDDRFDHIFQTFWNRHLLSWLERQWCLKGLRSCLVVLSEGQKYVKSGHCSRVIALEPDIPASYIPQKDSYTYLF